MKKILLSFGLLGLLLLSVRSFAQTTYTKITSSSGLEAGAHYIIVGHHEATGVLAMGYQKPNNRKAVMVSENGDAITVTPGTDPDSETDVFQFTLGGSAGAWTFFDEVKGGYLYAPSSTSNYLRTQAVLDANGQWSIVFNIDGTAEVVAQGENTRNNMRFNPDNYPDGDPRFSCYTETSTVDTRVSFYKAGGTAEPDHAYVDLGLPSGTLWATCNVGADMPEGYGDHFAWGETQPKDSYGWNNYQYCNGSGSSLIKYCSNSSYGYLNFTDTLTILLPEDDAATANWGNGWRMPTEEEWQELYQNTPYTLTTQNGVNGWLFTASNGNSLFLPFPGYRSSSSIYFAGDYGYYWSSSLCTSQPNYACYFYCGSDSYSYYGLYSNYGRSRGLSVRAVRSGSQGLSYTINVLASPDEGGTVTGGGTYNQGATCTLTATAYEDYNFVNWTENGEVVSVNSVYSFTVTSNRNLVANFNQTTPDNYVITATANPTEGGTVNMGGMANLLYDTFEEYSIGNKIASAAIANGHDWWTTWDNLPGSNEDGVVAYYDGTQCGHLTYGNDQILLLGNPVNGLYDLQFDVLVPNGKNGYFTVMHHFAGPNTEWAMQCFLHMTSDGSNMTSSPGHGTLHAGSVSTADIPCVYDEWMHFRIHIDIDNDVAQLYFNVVGQPEAMYAEWQWSLNLYGTDVIDGTIEAVNFYPPMSSQTSEFYLDNVRFSQFNEKCLTANNDGHTFAEMNSERDAVRIYDYYEYGDICTLIAMANEGYNFVNWTKNNTEVSTNPNYSFTVTEDATFVANFSTLDDDPLTYSINADGVSVTVTGHVDGTAATGELVIPETKTIDGVTYTVTAIGGWAFSGCTGLTGNLVIPNTVTFIGNGAFSNCSGFTGSLTIPNSVTTISYRAFYCCSGFTGSLTIGESVTTIGEQAFSACTGFSCNLILGNSVTLIDFDAFFNCNGFTGTLTIPSSVNVIYDWAFGYCSGFTAIHSLASVPPHAHENVFNSLDYDIPVTVPCDSRSLYQNAWGWNVFTNIQEDCSGMYAVSATANPIEGGSVIFGTEGESLFADTFEEYTVGNQIATEALAVGNDWWSTWSGVSGGEEDGFVADYNDTHCGHLVYGNDQILLLNRDSGVYDIEFDILVPEGKNAFFSLLHQFDETVNEAMYCHLHMTNENYQNTLNPGHGSIRAGNFILTDIPCVFDAWMHFRFRVDINADIARFYYTAPESEETILCQWPWSWNSNTAAYTDSGLAAMDFWPPMDGATSEYYIDNFSLKQLESGDLTMSGNHFAPGATCTLTAIPNEGYSFINWTENGEEVSTESVYSFIVTGDADYVANFTPNQGEITQVSNFSQGYNWWGTYIELDGIDGLGMLEEGLGDNGVTIRSQVGFTDYYQGYGWYGSLSSINNESTYRVITSAPCAVTMTGNVAVPSQHPITLGQGWTWIGYVPSTAMDINEALAGLDAMMGDKVKSQQGYSDYYGEDYGWYGSLSTMEPGMGLMYYSTNGNPVTFTYPDGNRVGEMRANLTSEHNHWVPNVHAYPDNMTVMAVVELGDMELTSDNYELAVFAANGECRGSVKLVYAEPLHRHVAFLTISGKDAAELSFRLYDTETNEEYYDAEESLDFVANAIVGEANDLYVVHFRGTTSMDEFASRVKVYPNPVNAGERFSIGMDMDIKSSVRVEIVNALGAVVFVETSTQALASIVAPITAGVYTLRITVEGKGTIVRKLVVK